MPAILFNADLSEQQSEKQLDAAAVEEDANSREFQFDEQRNKKLNRRLDIRLLPLLCWVRRSISASRRQHY